MRAAVGEPIRLCSCFDDGAVEREPVDDRRVSLGSSDPNELSPSAVPVKVRLPLASDEELQDVIPEPHVACPENFGWTESDAIAPGASEKDR